MSRRQKPAGRCARCRLYERLCLCASLPRLDTRTRLCLVIHRDELHKPTNSGLLAVASLRNSELCVRGVHGGDAASLALDATTQPLLLFPHADARPLADWARCPRPITLVVPDGTWRQAARVRGRVAGLAEVPCVTLPPEPTPPSRLRAQPDDARLPTLLAIARALGVLEDAATRAALEQLFAALVDRTLRLRGRLAELRP
ncbi:MAG TPA: tRNA-uridine aminocarboxypropyltransferase [Polyangia bacterium]